MEEASSVILILGRYFGSSLNPAQEETILKAFKKEHFSKKEIIFRQGDQNTRHYFIQKGLLRLYLIDPNGKEINILFARENQVIGDLATPDPTSFYLGTTEDSIVYSIEDEQFRMLFDQIDMDPSFDPGRGLRRSYVHIQNRLVSILSKPAEDNYLEFQKRYPDLIQRLPQYHIASYLGISPEFLSKLIARTARKM
jgi:CRP-like cAMP-binding protein